VRDALPVVAGLLSPGRASQRQQRCVGGQTRGYGVGGHSGSERVGCVDHGVDVLTRDKVSQSCWSAEAAKTRWYDLGQRVLCRPAKDMITSRFDCGARSRLSAMASLVPLKMSTRMALPLNEIDEETSEARTCLQQRWLSIIGIGEDGVDGLPPVARHLVEAAELVVGGARHLGLAQGLIRGEALPWPSPMQPAYAKILERRGQPVVVLASGDPFNFGVGKSLADVVPAGEFFCLPQPSSFSLAAARLGWALQDVETLSVHGRALNGIVRYLHPGARLFVLSWDDTTPEAVAKLLSQRFMGGSQLTVLEALGGARERVRTTTAYGFNLDGIQALNILAVDVVADQGAPLIGYAPGLDDDMFESDGQLTRREVRAVTLASLAPRRGELLWDIGLGSGSVAIEWLLAHRSMTAIGIETKSARAGRAARNAAQLGCPHLEIVQGGAPGVLSHLQTPDAVFIGGGLTCPGVFDAAWHALRPGGRLVANAVTLESEARLTALASQYGGELVRIAVSRAEPVGRFHGWRPAMPVTQWRVVKP
ncbi:MAG: precorrin-6y C5,15-methyltransferase (decarboxylating) subunit CbiE, partial [Pseudomonadota bacterium]